MVKLQKQFAYQYKGKDRDKTHYKHVITLPENIVKKLGWIEGNEIQFEITDNKLVLSLGSSSKKKKQKGEINE